MDDQEIHKGQDLSQQPEAGEHAESAEPGEIAEFRRDLANVGRTINELHSAIARGGEATQERFRRLEPPAKDPLDEVAEGVADGPEGSDEYNLKEDIRTILPSLKALRAGLFPEGKKYEQLLTLAFNALDGLRFEVEELRDMLPPEKRPAALRHLEKIEAARKDLFEKSGRKVLPRRRDAWKQVQEQLAAEERAKAAKEPQRRPSNPGGKRSFEEIDAGVKAGTLNARI